MTEKELILKLQSLNQIKPRQEWVSLVKTEILGLESLAGKPTLKEKALQVLSLLSPVNYQKKLAYALSVLLMIFGGVLGFAQYTLPGDTLFSVKEITENSQASLTGESAISTSAIAFKRRSQDLAQVIKDKKSANMPSAIQKVKDAAKTLAQALEKDPGLAREIAFEMKDSKALLDISGGVELKEASGDLDNLYKAVLTPVLDDYKANKKNLTAEQIKIIEESTALYEKGKYSEALEKIFLIN